jgi:hypothetical protein
MSVVIDEKDWLVGFFSRVLKWRISSIFMREVFVEYHYYTQMPQTTNRLINNVIV